VTEDCTTIRLVRPTYVESGGHLVTSYWAECFMLPILGPTSYLMLRRLNHLIGQGEDGTAPDSPVVDLCELAAVLGVAAPQKRQDLADRALKRLLSFGVVRWESERAEPERVLVVPTRVPSLTQRQIARLPESLQREYVK